MVLFLSSAICFAKNLNREASAATPQEGNFSFTNTILLFAHS